MKYSEPVEVLEVDDDIFVEELRSKDCGECKANGKILTFFTGSRLCRVGGKKLVTLLACCSSLKNGYLLSEKFTYVD